MALGQIEKQFGKGSIMRLGENAHMRVETIPRGPWPRRGPRCGRPAPGPDRGDLRSGVLGEVDPGYACWLAEAQRNGGACAYIDAEHAHGSGLRQGDRG